MTMLHDTFCTPSTFDKHRLINEITCTNNHTLRVDTLFRLSFNNNGYTLPPPSLRSSNSSLTTASSTSSSNDEATIINDDHHNMVLWVQRQLGFYTALSIIPPRISSIGDGKMLLCLIHRFAPHTLPHLVAILERHTSTECLAFADDLAQQLWHVSIESLVNYLHRHYYHDTSRRTLADHVDSLISSPSFTTPGEQLSCNDETDDDDVQQHAPSVPIWQHQKEDSYTRWISATHQSIDSYLHHPHTSRLSVLLLLLDQLASIYVDFTRLTMTTAASAPDYLLPTRQLLGRLQEMDNPLASLTTTTTLGDDDDDLVSQSDILLQRHAWLLICAEQALDLFEKANRVQIWMTMQQSKWVPAWTEDQEKHKAWLDGVRRYRQEDPDVLALAAYVSSFGDTTRLVARITKPMVIKALDGLDALMAQSHLVEQHVDWLSMAAEWEGLHVAASTSLETWYDSVQRLIQQATWKTNPHQVSHQSLLQQWKILSRRLDQMEHHGDYAAVVCLYQKLSLAVVAFPKMVDVEKDYALLLQQWKQLPASLDLARQRITQHKRIEDYSQQCHLAQLNATDLERQLGATGNLCDKRSMAEQVGELDKTIAGLLAFTTEDFGDDGNSICYWQDQLSQSQLDYQNAWQNYQSKWARLQRQRELETIKRIMDGQLDMLQSVLFDPWTHCMDDMGRLKRSHVERKRHFLHTVVNRFDQWTKSAGEEEPLGVDVHTGIEKGQQLLADYDQQLNLLENRQSWERQWHKATIQVQHTANAVHALVDLGGDRMDDIQRQVWESKHTVEQVQLVLDELLAMNNGHGLETMDRMLQRQQILGDQVNELEAILDAAHVVLGQSAIVNTYMNSVDDILDTSRSLGRCLEADLLSPSCVETVGQQEEIRSLAMSAVLLWEDTGSHIPYPSSFLVVDDLVRWKVLVAYGDVMAAAMYLAVDGLDAYTRRIEWEKQWELDMDGLNHDLEKLSMWLQQYDCNTLDMEGGDNSMVIVDKYSTNPYHRLEQYFTAMQEAYPANLKIPIALKKRHQQLTVDKYDHVKSLCSLVKYLQTAWQVEKQCGHMNISLDQKGADATEDLAQQWMDDIKVHVEQELFMSLCDQQIQLQDGVGTFGKEKVELVRGKASKMLGDLQERLAATLRTSQHLRLVQAYGQSATVLESSLHQLQDELTSLANEHTNAMLGGCPEPQQLLQTKWEDTKLALETTHDVSYNDVQSLCQLIQLQKAESDVLVRQSRLDDLWQAMRQDLNGVQEHIRSLARWKDISSSLDNMQATLTPLAQWVDMTTMAIHDGNDKEAVGVLTRIYREAHAMSTVVREVILCYGDRHEQLAATLIQRLDGICDVLDGLRTALLCFANQRFVNEYDVARNRLASWMDISLFDYDGTQTLVLQFWDELNNKAETSRVIYDLLASIYFLCECKPLLNSCKGNNDDTLLEICRESMTALSVSVEMEQYCLKGLLLNALEYGRLATTLFVGLDRFDKDLTEFTLNGISKELVDWQLHIRAWQHKLINFEKTEMHVFLDKVNKWLLLNDETSGDGDGELVKALDAHVVQCMRGLVQNVVARLEKIKAQLDDTTSEVTSWQLKKVAERQWQHLLDSLETACNHATTLVSEFYHDNDPVMLSQEQDLMEAQQALTTLAYETRPVLAMKANEVKTALNVLTTTWLDHGDVDRALDGWEQTLQQYQQHLRHNISMCQYWVAAAEVQGNLCILEKLLDDGEKTKFKVYMDVLDTSLEKTRQAATLVEGSGRTEYALLVAKRNKLERQFNTHQRWLGAPTGGGLQRCRKISLPSKMPSQNHMGRPPNAYVADPQNDLDMEIGRIVNKVPYKVELNMVPGEAGRYRFGTKVVYCRILKSRMVMVRVGGGWTELSQFLRDHALLVGSKSTTTTMADGCQEMFLDTKRATSPTSGRPVLLPRMSQSTTTTTPSSISDNAGYKDGDRYIAVDLQGYQHEMKMTPHDSNNTKSSRRYS